LLALLAILVLTVPSADAGVHVSKGTILSVDCIDRWIGSANGEYAVDWKRQRAEQAASAAEQRRRLDEARSKFALL
jgi:hypothetical protein